MSFPPGTEMFQFPGFASAAYGFSGGYSLRSGLPHSEIPGSKPARGSPRLFAACHVLHRLLAPRHPPDALAFLDPHQRHHHRPAPADAGTRARARQSKVSGRGRRRTIPATTTTQSWPFRAAATAQAYPCQMRVLPADGRDQKNGRTRDLPMPVTQRTHKDHGSLHAPCPHDGHLVTTSRCPNNKACRPARARRRASRNSLVGLGRLERPTSRLSGVRSNQLSYRPKVTRAEPEPDSQPTRPTRSGPGRRLLAKGRADGGGHR